MRTTYIFNLILKYTIINLCFMFLITSCSQESLLDTFDNPYMDQDDPVTSTDLKQDKYFTRFDFLKSQNTGLPNDVSGYIDGSTIELMVPLGFDISGLVPCLSIDGASISPRNGVRTNFSGGPVEYIVTAEDGTEKVYSVTVDNGSPVMPGAPANTSFTSPMKINLTGGNESDFKEFRFTLTGTAPASCNHGLVAQVGTDIDIPSTITLKAIACDNFGNASAVMTRVYSYTPPTQSSDKDIIAFNFLRKDNYPGTGPGLYYNVIGVISGSIIELTVPKGTDITNLVPSITHTGSVVTPNSGVAKDFSPSAFIYKVTAADSTTKEYTVIVNEDLNLVTNGSFEVAIPLFWNSSDMHLYGQSTDESAMGNYSMYLHNDGTAEIDALHQIIEIDSNTNYQLSLKMKVSSDTSSGRVVFDMDDVFDDLPDPCQFIIGAADAGSWRSYSCTFYNSSITQIRLRFFQHVVDKLDGFVYLDAVKLKKVP